MKIVNILFNSILIFFILQISSFSYDYNKDFLRKNQYVKIIDGIVYSKEFLSREYSYFINLTGETITVNQITYYDEDPDKLYRDVLMKFSNNEYCFTDTHYGDMEIASKYIKTRIDLDLYNIYDKEKLAFFVIKKTGKKYIINKINAKEAKKFLKNMKYECGR